MFLNMLRWGNLGQVRKVDEMVALNKEIILASHI